MSVSSICCSLEDLSNLASLQAPAPVKGQDPEDIPKQTVPYNEDTSVSVVGALSRQTSGSLTVQTPRALSADWSRQITLEERHCIREKIKSAYNKKFSGSYEDLLETCAAIEEELVFAGAPSRLDYFKSGVQYEKRINEKVSQLRNGFTTSSLGVGTPSDTDLKIIKRAKTTH